MTAGVACLLGMALTLTAAGQGRAPARVYVLSTLHQFHESSSYFSFDELTRTIERIRPDVVCVELTAADLKSRKEQRTKQEYQRSVFPLADKLRFRLVPLEPDEPEFTALVALARESEQGLRTDSPAKAEAFSAYAELLYKQLFAEWDSPLAVNSHLTDTHFELKHSFQNALYGEKQEGSWNGWNQHFLERIREAARENHGKKVLVLVGVEHAYWLRKALKKEAGIRLVEPSRFLKGSR